MTSPNKSYSIQAEKQENIGGFGAVSGFQGAALLSMTYFKKGYLLKITVTKKLWTESKK